MKKTLYVSRPVINAQEIYVWFSRQGVFGVTAPEKMHVTVAYSTAVVDWDFFTPDKEVLSFSGGIRSLEQFGDASVLVFLGLPLVRRWHEFDAAGASFSYSPYRPHITFAYGKQIVDFSKLLSFDGKIALGGEVFAELDKDWDSQ